MRIKDGIKLDFDSVLIEPKRSFLESRKNVNLKREFRLLNSGQTISGIPVMSANMSHTGTIEMAKVLTEHGLFSTLHKYVYKDIHALMRDGSNDDSASFEKMVASRLMFFSIGMDETSLDRFQTMPMTVSAPLICIDVANGHTETFLRFVEKVRKLYPTSPIMAGNVVSPEMTIALLRAGADIVKIGIGPGSVCTTRTMTGVGYPQLSAIIECADAAHGINGHICADGGCQTPGDVAKAFGAGADFVMLGGMFAGHHECAGMIHQKNHGSEKIAMMEFFGMSSEAAMNQFNNGVSSYRAPEGKTIFVPYRGFVEGTIQNILGGLRSTCTYVGTNDLKHLSKCTTFVVLNDVSSSRKQG